MTQSTEELYRLREQRVLDAIALKKPDAVPILPMFGFFMARYAGMTVQEVMYDPDKLFEAQWKTLVDFKPDMDNNPFPLRFLGPILETLDYRQLRWPGHGLTADHTYQFVEGEYMLPEEYDHFLLDPLDYLMRKYWPRVFGALKGFEKLPPLHNFICYYMGVPTGFAAFTLPEVKAALNTMMAAGEQSMQIISYSKKYVENAKQAGFPMQFGGVSQAPMDTLGDFFRGTKGVMLDMYRRPEQVVKACEKLLPIMVEMAVNATRASGIPRVFIPLHKGIDGFMSEAQFQRFFWPTLRELILALIAQGLTPCLLWEGNCTSRLHIIKDIPEGKAVYAFEATDMATAKKILGQTVCIRGNVPLSLLFAGTPEDVRAYCKKLIDSCARDGGFIMDSSAGLEDAKPENVRAMFDFTRDYGAKN
jgi:uroporphyrinogen-III decarboxylase